MVSVQVQCIPGDSAGGVGSVAPFLAGVCFSFLPGVAWDSTVLVHREDTVYDPAENIHVHVHV